MPSTCTQHINIPKESKRYTVHRYLKCTEVTEMFLETNPNPQASEHLCSKCNLCGTWGPSWQMSGGGFNDFLLWPGPRGNDPISQIQCFKWVESINSFVYLYHLLDILHHDALASVTPSQALDLWRNSSTASRSDLGMPVIHMKNYLASSQLIWPLDLCNSILERNSCTPRRSWGPQSRP